VTILRVQKDRENPYVILNKQFLEDPEISLKLKGFLAYCLSKPDNWKFHIRHLASVLKEGKSCLYAIINEGIQYGYIERGVQRNEGKFETVDYIIHETRIKEKSTVSGNPDTENPDTEKRTLLSNDILLSTDKKNKTRPSASPPPQAVELSNFLLNSIKKIKPDIKTPNLEDWSVEMDRMMRIDKRSFESIKRLIEWLPTHTFWSCHILSADKLREKFDKLELAMSVRTKETPRITSEWIERLQERVKHDPNLTVNGEALVFANGMGYWCIKFSENGAKEQIINKLRKMNISLEGLTT